MCVCVCVCVCVCDSVYVCVCVCLCVCVCVYHFKLINILCAYVFFFVFSGMPQRDRVVINNCWRRVKVLDFFLYCLPVSLEQLMNLSWTERMCDHHHLRSPAPVGIVDHIVSLSENFGELVDHDEYADITLVVENTHFKGHKIILAARSEYFRWGRLTILYLSFVKILWLMWFDVWVECCSVSDLDILLII